MRIIGRCQDEADQLPVSNADSIRFFGGSRWSFAPLREYMDRKLEELDAHAADHVVEPGMTSDPRRLPNIGTLRAYIVSYLKQHPDLDTEGMTFLVRQLKPGSQGLPIEIYVFSSDTRWSAYEDIQADIFDHILAMIPEFGLRAFQEPSGADVRVIACMDSADDGEIDSAASPAWPRLPFFRPPVSSSVSSWAPSCPCRRLSLSSSSLSRVRPSHRYQRRWARRQNA